MIIVNEILDLAKRDKKKCLAVKFDFEKAYDSMTWSFLDYMLLRINFYAQWRRWMRGCYMTSSISVLVNGIASNEFTATKRLKKGDPLTPFLFLVVVEGLTRLVPKFCGRKYFQRILY